ncbi:MAG: hypothetical protein K0Q52_3504 [Microbacterium sp.]|nr:hypothetical protein [Microbacterium sp.]
MLRAIAAAGDGTGCATIAGAEVPVIPVIGVSSLAQLEEALGAAHLVLDAEVRARLDAEPGDAR